MTDPVMTVNGHVYDRVFIERWFNTRGPVREPLTNELLSSTALVPQKDVKRDIRKWVSRQLLSMQKEEDGTARIESNDCADSYKYRFAILVITILCVLILLRFCCNSLLCDFQALQ